MCRVFCGAEKSCFFLFLKKNVGTPHVLQGVFIIYVALTTIRITYVHVKGAGILIINSGNTYYSSFYANARSKTLVKNVKK